MRNKHRANFRNNKNMVKAADEKRESKKEILVVFQDKRQLN